MALVVTRRNHTPEESKPEFTSAEIVTTTAGGALLCWLAATAHSSGVLRMLR